MPLPLHKNVTIGALAVAVISSLIALSNAVILLSGPIHVLTEQYAGRIIAAASIIGGIGAVLAGLGKSPLEPASPTIAGTAATQQKPQ
jgi:hypothetical protein